jgi:hypothetical protein
MLETASQNCALHPELHALTHAWGSNESVALYLDRCQVDTPPNVVAEVWRQIRKRRKQINLVVDYGAGDGRFALEGNFKSYVGFEIDSQRCKNASLPKNARLLNQCAFSAPVLGADLCVGNPPYVCNQDLPSGWRQTASDVLRETTGVSLSGLANAWQYFFLWSLATSNESALCALIIPYEWVSRPSAKAIRELIRQKGWSVSVYRLLDTTFHRVLTTSSITIVDKRGRSGPWRYFQQTPNGAFDEMATPTGSDEGVLAYARRAKRTVVAKRGLSPGTQKVFALTESERARFGLKIGTDVLPCVKSLRSIEEEEALTSDVFRCKFRDRGERCWLINISGTHSRELSAYIRSIRGDQIDTQTCRARTNWWSYTLPNIPEILIATGFRGNAPKVILNSIGAIAVGSVAGVYVAKASRCRSTLRKLREMDLSGSIVPHSNGLKKLEINQLNTVLDSI